MTVLSDLLVVCADGPTSAQQLAASRLLAQELAARVSAGGFDFEFSGRFSIRELGDHAGPGATENFRSARGPGSTAFAVNGGYGARPRVPPPGSLARYSAELAAVTSEGAPLVAAVRAAMGDDAFDSRRRHLQGVGAAPSAAFGLSRLLEPTVTGSAVFAFPAGTFRIQFTGNVWSRSLTEPETVSIGVAVDGVVVLTWSLVRPPLPPTFPPRSPFAPRDVAVHFDLASANDVITLSSPGVITLVNAGAFEQSARGVLRVFPD